MKNIEIVKIKMVKDTMTECKYKKGIKNPWDAYKVLNELLQYEDREHFLVVTLNTKKEINNISVVSIGTLNMSCVHPREVFKTAILSNAHKIIVAHNHPSGYVEPSKEDKKITERILECGKILGIELLDHIIIGGGYYFSFKEKGII